MLRARARHLADLLWLARWLLRLSNKRAMRMVFPADVVERWYRRP